jgi:hypothetical protein
VGKRNPDGSLFASFPLVGRSETRGLPLVGRKRHEARAPGGVRKTGLLLVEHIGWTHAALPRGQCPEQNINTQKNEAAGPGLLKLRVVCLYCPTARQ